jgi:hypothetical protein
MKISLHIERLVLDGLAMNGHDSARLGAAVEAELARLLRLQGRPPAPRAAAVAALQAQPIRMSAQTAPRKLGAQIAQSVYGSIGGKHE